MLFEEKEQSEEEDNSNYENEFKELDDEIDRVIHGEASSEEKKTIENNVKSLGNFNISNYSNNANEFIIDLNKNTKDINENWKDIHNDINQKKIIIDKYKNFDDSKYTNQTAQNLSINSDLYPNNIIHSINFRDEDKFQTNIFNCSDNSYDIKKDYINQSQNRNNELKNNIQPSNQEHNINYKNNSNFNLSQYNTNNNYYKFSPNGFNQFNYYNFNGCINLNNNKNNLEPHINNINNVINNIGNKREVINANYKCNQFTFPIKEQLIEKIKSSKNIQNSFINNFNQIYNNNNYNYINNCININVSLLPIDYYQLHQASSIYQNNIILNKLNNLNLNNKNINICMQNNNYFNLFSKDKFNNIKPKNLLNNNDIIEKKEKAISDEFKNFNNPEKNLNSYKRKIFNPIPDSEKKKNIINLLDILQRKDMRTTLMIKNIPNKYTISTFLDEIGYYFKDTYDVFYLPIDYINKCNLGFAFINFVEPFHIILFYELYRGKKWKKYNSEKICELLYAKFQGKRQLIAHFEKGKIFSLDSEEKKPLILPTPNPLPRINIPIYYLTIFTKLYPKISYEIIDYYNSDNNNGKYSNVQIFSINGNFRN